ncbi:glycosyltransferase family 39 protein [Candidatus Woesearchaeota archaeon]|nr:glycosyltransferase family 39 protein [Candidatus Woesearchaeota archaeon]
MADKYRKYLFFVLLFALALRLVFFTGADNSDTLAYYEYAYQASKGNFNLDSNHFSSRIGLIYPQAIVYKLFGINEITSNILSLIVSLAGIILIFYLGRFMFNEKTGLVAALLLSFYPLDVIFSTRLLPDFPSAFFMALSVLFFLKAEKFSSKRHYLYSGLSWGIAYLIKEMAIVLALFFAGYALYKRRLSKNHLLILAVFVIFPAIEFLHAYALTSDPFFRHSQIQNEEIDFVKDTYSNYFSVSGMLSRLFFHWPFLMLHDVHYGLFFAFVFLALFYSLIYRKYETSVLLIWLVALMLYLNFGPLSLVPYVPIPITVKFLSTITFPSLLLLANFLCQNDKLLQKVLLPSAILLLLLSSLGFIYISEDRQIISEIKQSHGFLKSLNSPVYTDERTKSVLDYLSGFERNNFLAFNEFNYYAKGNEKNALIDLKDKHNVYIAVNHGMIKGLREVYKGIEFPNEISNMPKNWQEIRSFGEGDKKMIVYYAS